MQRFKLSDVLQLYTAFFAKLGVVVSEQIKLPESGNHLIHYSIEFHYGNLIKFLGSNPKLCEHGLGFCQLSFLFGR